MPSSISIPLAAFVLIAAVLSSSTVTAAAAPPPPPPPPRAPACGNATISPKPGYHNVLIVGDSISMVPPFTPGGYGAVVQHVLESRNPPIFVQHAGGWYSGAQCSNTVKGLLCTTPTSQNNYLNVSGKFDVVHINYGLHDLVNCTDIDECKEHVDLSTYGDNLVTLVQRFSKIGNKIAFATTTPIPNVPTSLGRTYQLAIDYNNRARQALQPLSIPIDDLWQAVIDVCGKEYTTCPLQLPKNVHLSPQGETVLGQHVADFVVDLLGL